MPNNTVLKPFTLPLYSKLRRLIEQAPFKSAPGADWWKWLNAQTQHGLNQKELMYSDLCLDLEDSPEKQTSTDILQLIKKLPSDIEILINKQEVPRALLFEEINQPFPLSAKLERPTSPHDPAPLLTHRQSAYDFHIVRIWRQDLLGHHNVWMVLDKNGKPWKSKLLPGHSRTCFFTADAAYRWCRMVSKAVIPSTRKQWKHRTRWSDIRLDGGDNYTEWLITLPNHHFIDELSPQDHFDAENLLMHIRSSIYSVDGKRVLLIEELQSDYNQHISKLERETDEKHEINPYQKTWVELGLRIAILIACRQGLDGVGISNGNMHDVIYTRSNKGRATFYDVMVAKALEKTARTLSAEFSSTIITATTQHYAIEESTYQDLHETIRPCWKVIGIWGADEKEKEFYSHADALRYKTRMLEREVKASIPVLWMEAKARAELYQAGLPLLGSLNRQ